MADLSFQEVCTLLKESRHDMQKVFDHQDEIMDFANRMDSIGADVFQGKDSEYIFDMLAIIQSLACTLMILRGSNPRTVATIINDDEMLKYTTFIMKLTVGLAVLEELR